MPTFPATATFPGTLELTNVTKLSLPSNTSIGTKVRVTDGLKVSGAGTLGVDGPYVEDGAFNDEPRYRQIGGDSNWIAVNFPEAPYWQLGSSNDASGSALYVADYIEGPNEAPWLSTWSTIEGDDPVPSFSYPVVQQLAVSDPSNELHWTTL